MPWFGLLAPTGTPKDDLDKLHRETVKALAVPEVRKKFDELGLDGSATRPPSLPRSSEEMPQWAKVIKDAGIKLGN